MTMGSADSIFTYSYDLVVTTADDGETLDAFPHCSDFCATRTGLTYANAEDVEVYVMPFSEHETTTYLVCHHCGGTFGRPEGEEGTAE